MIRAAFLACGLFLTLCGVALLFVDRVVLTEYAGRRLREAARSESSALRLVYAAEEIDASSRDQVIDPPDWGGFCVLSVGGVTLLYALCLPGRKPEEGDDEDS